MLVEKIKSRSIQTCESSSQICANLWIPTHPKWPLKHSKGVPSKRPKYAKIDYPSNDQNQWSPLHPLTSPNLGVAWDGYHIGSANQWLDQLWPYPSNHYQTIRARILTINTPLVQSPSCLIPVFIMFIGWVFFGKIYTGSHGFSQQIQGIHPRRQWRHRRCGSPAALGHRTPGPPTRPSCETQTPLGLTNGEKRWTRVGYEKISQDGFV